MDVTSLQGIPCQFVGHQATLVDQKWHWKRRPRRIMTRTHVFSFPLSMVRVSSSFANDVDHVSKPSQLQESYNAIPNHNSLQRKHIIEQELMLSIHEHKVSIVTDEENIERGAKTWCDPQLDRIPTINSRHERCIPWRQHLSQRLPKRATFARNERDL
jgi:hypothetical protein